jgi:hypothetical protein
LRHIVRAPLVLRGTGLDANEARRQFLEERQDVPPVELTAKNHFTIRIDAMNLEN